MTDDRPPHVATLEDYAMTEDQKLFCDDLAYKLKNRVGQKYQPSNGSEGEHFVLDGAIAV
jgi:hypothetical protein